MISKILQIRSLEQFFLTVGQNNFGNKITFLHLLAQPVDKNVGSNLVDFFKDRPFFGHFVKMRLQIDFDPIVYRQFVLELGTYFAYCHPPIEDLLI